MANSKDVLILLDSDVIVHLFKAERISLLNELYPNRIRMLDIVYSELMKNPTVNKMVGNLFLWKQVETIQFPLELMPELKTLELKMNGVGERACLVYCKHNNHIIASSNTSDIIPYCKANSIAYLITLDILCIAICKGIIDEKEANILIEKITYKKGSYLCCKIIEEHLKNHFDKEKLLY